MDIIEKVKNIDKAISKYFVLLSIITYAFLFGWHYAGGKTIFSSFFQDLSILFILVNQGVIIGYLTWYRE
tara:strand:- start:12933 stop:13142 length:210 start_codon:yes stop_codon:yes gene_type:complete